MLLIHYLSLAPIHLARQLLKERLFLWHPNDAYGLDYLKYSKKRPLLHHYLYLAPDDLLLHHLRRLVLVELVLLLIHPFPFIKANRHGFDRHSHNIVKYMSFFFVFDVFSFFAIDLDLLLAFLLLGRCLLAFETQHVPCGGNRFHQKQFFRDARLTVRHHGR
jgi:hypothetical protein